EGGRGGEHLLLNVAVLVTQPEGNLPALGDHVHVEAPGDLVAGDGQLSFPHGALLLSSPLLYRSRQPLSTDLRPGKICGIVVAYWRCARCDAGKEAETDHVRGAKIFQRQRGRKDPAAGQGEKGPAAAGVQPHGGDHLSAGGPG